jgi:ABC-type transport system involved in multi-copper enzyme maturation permease subunit
MKYLAILKDSLREAVDTKIIYFTLLLSGLLILLIGNVSFRPVPAEEQFDHFTQQVNFLLNLATQGQGLRYKIEDFEQTNPGAEPWKGDYRFILAMELPSEKHVNEFKKQENLAAPQLRDQLEEAFPWLDKVQVTNAPSEKPLEVRFLVQTTGTKVADRRGWTHEPGLFFGSWPISLLRMPLAKAVEFITDDVIGTFGAAVTMLISTIITAFFIPNMLRKGNVDLLLAKPIHRTTLLVYKFIGGLTFMFLNTAVVMVGIWFVLGLQTGLWLNGLLLCILIFTFQFAIFYAVSTEMAVLTRSPIVAILTTVVIWALLFGIGIGYRFIDRLRPEKLKDLPPQAQLQIPGWVFITADVIHFVTPHYKDLDKLTTKLIRSDLLDRDSDQRKQLDKEVGSINWTESIVVTVLFIVVMLGLSCWRFAVKDY